MYVKAVNNTVVKFPYNLGDLYKENPGTSFPEEPTVDTLAPYGVYRVVQTPAPSIDSKTHRQLQSAEQIGGVWTQVWAVQQLPESTAAVNVRAHRNSLLSECDWTQVDDAPVDKAAWATYRQELRDITAQAGFPWNVTWPVEP